MQTLYAYSYNPAIVTGTNTTGTVWRMAYQSPFHLYKGTSNTIKVVVFNDNQKVVDLTHYVLEVQIVDRSTNHKLITKFATVTAPTSGVASVTFTSSDLSVLDQRFYSLCARLFTQDDGSTLVTQEILYIDDNFTAFTPVLLEDSWNFTTPV